MASPYDTFPADWAGVPPAMPAGDLEVWRKFHPTAMRLWSSIAYDVEVRDGPWPIVSDDPAMQRMWMRNTARRIDAFCWANNVGTIIEVRHAAAWQSYGQLMGYTNLWRTSYPEIPVVAAWLVTDVIPADIRQVANDAGLYVWTPEALTQPAKPLQVMPPGTVTPVAPYQV